MSLTTCGLVCVSESEHHQSNPSLGKRPTPELQGNKNRNDISESLNDRWKRQEIRNAIMLLPVVDIPTGQIDAMDTE